MKPQPSEKVSINSHELTSTQNTYLPVQNCLSNLPITILIYIKLEYIIHQELEFECHRI